MKPPETNEYVTKDSFIFAKNIISIKADGFLVSLDIESLFTTLALNETIKLCSDKLNSDNDLVSGLNRREFKILMEIAAQENMFMFDRKFYKQTDGVAKGSPIGPILFNIFLCHHEKLWLEQCLIPFKPFINIRYVDDIFLLFSDIKHLQLFEQFMNISHTNIKFTTEAEKNNQLVFVDSNITRHGESFLTGICRKSTFSGIYTNYNSLIPSQYKTGLVTALLEQCFQIAGSYEIVHKEVEKLKTIMTKNACPKPFLDEVTNYFLDKTCM